MKKMFVVLLLIVSLSACSKSGEDMSGKETSGDTSSKPVLENFFNSSNGISFAYPKGWLLDQSDSEGVFQVQVANSEAPDGYDCDQDYAVVIVGSTVRDTSEDFDTWFENNRSEDPGLGQYGGDVVETEFAGYPAYSVSKMGWETYCPAYGYVVDYTDAQDEGRIVEIIISKKLEESLEIENILQSIVLAGKQ